jgi:NADP-dependent alcohol dehydrogenase
MRQMGCPVRISEAGIVLNSDALVAHLEQAKHTSLGENADIHPDDVRAILRMAA